MARSQPIPSLQQEVELSIEPASSSSILHISPNDRSNSHIFGAGRKRGHEEIEEVDEPSFVRNHLASESSIFFRAANKSPRCFLWRVLNDRKTLEVQSVDLVQKHKHAREESLLTYRIALPASIIPGGVVLADSTDHDALEVFALTTSNDLYTITLRRDLLLRESVPKDFDSSKCVTQQNLNSLSFRKPYRLAASNHKQLLISTQDGGFMSVEKKQDHWIETYYSEGGWTGTLRGLIPLKRHRTIKYGDIDLETNAATALIKTHDDNYIWTVNLDHTLNAWSVETGKIVARQDLLGQRRDLEDKNKQDQYLLTADTLDVMKLLQTSQDDADGDDTAMVTSNYFLAVYSSKERELKLYEFHTQDGSPRLRDAMQGTRLRLPFDELLNTNLWRLNSFHIKLGNATDNSKIFVNIQHGSHSKVLTLSIDLFNEDQDDLEKQWRYGWTLISNGGRQDDTPTLSTADQSASADRWLAYFLQPGRYTKASLQTALDIYRKRRKLIQPKSQRTQAGTFEERLCASIASKVLIPKTSKDRPDYAKYYADIHAQWLGYHSIVSDLQTRRHDTRAVSYDDATGLVWHVYADVVAPVCALDRVDKLTGNVGIDAEGGFYEQIEDEVKSAIIQTEDDWDTQRLLTAAQDFASSLPRAFHQSFTESAVREALLPAPEEGISKSAAKFLNGADVGQYVPDEIYQNLVHDLEPFGGVGGLRNVMIIHILELLQHTPPRGSSSNTTLNRYGSKVMTANAQALIRRNKSVMIDLLLLTAFVCNDFEAQELDEEFSAVGLFEAILTSLRQVELRDWLTRTRCIETSRDELVETTVYESLFIGDWDDHCPSQLDFSQRLTSWSKQWALAAFNDWHGFTANIFATLLRRRQYDLAANFEHFLHESSWTKYLRARLDLSSGELESASLLFAEAAVGLSKHTKTNVDTANLLTPEETNLLGAGLDQYYLHIANLFEQVKAFSYVADFAKLALSNIKEDEVDVELAAIDGRKNVTESPFDKVADARAELKLLKIINAWDGIVVRMFGALVQTGRFQEAYAALLKIKRPDLKRANLQKLIDGCVSNDGYDILLELPFEAEDAGAADAVLFTLAKKSLSNSITIRPAQQILYAFRTRRGDYRGAAQILYEYLERLRCDSKIQQRSIEDESLLEAYLILINTLACCGEGEQWLLADPIPGVHSDEQRRKLVTLDQIRRDYVCELDRRSDLQHGRFPLLADDDAMEL